MGTACSDLMYKPSESSLTILCFYEMGLFQLPTMIELVHRKNYTLWKVNRLVVSVLNARICHELELLIANKDLETYVCHDLFIKCDAYIKFLNNK